MDKTVLRAPQVRSANPITTIVKLFVNNSHKTGTFYSKEKLTTYHKPSTVDKELCVSDTFSPWDFASVLYLLLLLLRTTIRLLFIFPLSPCIKTPSRMLHPSLSRSIRCHLGCDSELARFKPAADLAIALPCLASFFSPSSAVEVVAVVLDSISLRKPGCELIRHVM